MVDKETDSKESTLNGEATINHLSSPMFKEKMKQNDIQNGISIIDDQNQAQQQDLENSIDNKGQQTSYPYSNNVFIFNIQVSQNINSKSNQKQGKDGPKSQKYFQGQNRRQHQQRHTSHIKRNSRNAKSVNTSQQNTNNFSGQNTNNSYENTSGIFQNQKLTNSHVDLQIKASNKLVKETYFQSIEGGFNKIGQRINNQDLKSRYNELGSHDESSNSLIKLQENEDIYISPYKTVNQNNKTYFGGGFSHHTQSRDQIAPKQKVQGILNYSSDLKHIDKQQHSMSFYSLNFTPEEMQNKQASLLQQTIRRQSFSSSSNDKQVYKNQQVNDKCAIEGQNQQINKNNNVTAYKNNYLSF